jgi:hypothetical protein
LEEAIKVRQVRAMPSSYGVDIELEDLHSFLFPQLFEVCSELFLYFGFSMLFLEVGQRWAVFLRADGWALKVQCEAPGLQKDCTQHGYTRSAKIDTTPGSDVCKNDPDVVIYYMPKDEKKVCFPLVYLDLKLRGKPADHAAQAHFYGHQVLFHNFSILRSFQEVRTSILSYYATEEVEPDLGSENLLIYIECLRRS